MFKKTGVVDAAFPRTQRYATVYRNDKLQIAYNLYPSPYPVKLPSKPYRDTRLRLVFAHGTGLQKEAWEPIIESFYSDPSLGRLISECYAYDLVSHGDSGLLNRHKIGFQATWMDFGKDVVAFCRNLNLDARTGGPVVLIGHSLGGASVLLAAAAEPEMFTSCISIEPVAYDRSLSSKDSATDPLRLFRYMQSSLKDEFNSEEEWLKYFDKKSMYSSFDPRTKSALRDTLAFQDNGKVYVKSPTWAHLQTYFAASLSLHTIFNSLLNIRIPTLHIVGGDARWNPPESVGAIIDSLGSIGEQIIIPKTGHMLVAEQPGLTADSMKSFLVRSRLKWVENEAYLDPATGIPNPAHSEDADLFITDVELISRDAFGLKVLERREGINNAISLASKGDYSRIPVDNITRTAASVGAKKAKL